MGADGSKSIPIVTNARKKKLVARWQKRQLPSQLFAVARHDERADLLCALINGVPWSRTDDFVKWPFDPPISDAGVEGARATGKRMYELTEANGCHIHIIITSPYYRCVQTAAEICRGLGDRTRLLIDRSLGEIYGPSVMGASEPVCAVRPIEHCLAYCNSRGVQAHTTPMGKWPTWPEQIRDARKRYANRFLTYLHRSAVAKRNFMVITHADCVGVALSLMPSQAHNAVEMVDHGGLFFAKREHREATKKSGANSDSKQPKKGSLTSIMPCGDAEAGDEDVTVYSPAPFLSEGEWVPDYRGWLNEATEHGASSTSDQLLSSGISFGSSVIDMPEDSLELPRTSDGWQVFTHGIQLRKKAVLNSSSRVSRLSKTMKTLTQGSQFSRHHIEKLLGELSEKPLLDDKELEAASKVTATMESLRYPSHGTFNTLPSTLSASTLAFGASDVGNDSECNSEVPSQLTNTLSRIPTIDDRIPTVEDFDPAGQLPNCHILSPRHPNVQQSPLKKNSPPPTSPVVHTRLSKRLSGGPCSGPATYTTTNSNATPSTDNSDSNSDDASPRGLGSPEELWGLKNPGSSRGSGPTDTLVGRDRRDSQRAKTLNILEKVDEKETRSRSASPDKPRTHETILINPKTTGPEAEGVLLPRTFETSALLKRRNSGDKSQDKPLVVVEEKVIGEKSEVPLKSSENSTLLRRRNMRSPPTLQALPSKMVQALPSKLVQEAGENAEQQIGVQACSPIDAKKLVAEASCTLQGAVVRLQQGGPTASTRDVARHLTT